MENSDKVLLKTVCHDCIFNTRGSYCDLNKKTFVQGGFAYTLGFCNAKRDKAWQAKGNQQNVFSRILKEENRITLIVKCLDNNISSLKVTLGNLFDKVNNIENVIIILKHIEKDYFNEIYEYLKNKSVKWTINNIRDDDFNFLSLAELEFDNIKAHWFLEFDYKDIINVDLLNKCIKYITSEQDKNYVGFRFDTQDGKQLSIVNKFVFKSLFFNKLETYENKLKDFENWKEKCPKITL